MAKMTYFGAPLDSPVFTGTPTAPTPAEGDSSTQIATTEFVQAAIAAVLADLQATNEEAEA